MLQRLIAPEIPELVMKSLCLCPIPLLIHFLNHQCVKTTLTILITSLKQIFYSSVLRQSPGFVGICLLEFIMLLPLDFVSLSIELKKSFYFMNVILVIQFDMGFKFSLCFYTLCYQSSTALLHIGACGLTNARHQCQTFIDGFWTNTSWRIASFF
jgi:hypothetical protein